MRYFLLLMSVSFFGCRSADKNKTCGDLHRGKFGFWSNNSDRKYFIERNDSVQIETDEISGAVMEFRIRWLSSCEYELVFNKFLKTGADSQLFQEKFRPVRTTILQITPDYYTFISRIEGFDKELTDTMGISKSY